VRDLLAASIEALGTFLFLFGAYGAINAQFASAAAAGMNPTGIAGPAGVLMIATAFGLSLLVVAWALYRVSGGIFNPAVTVGLVIAGAITARRGIMFFIAQLAGALCASGLIQALLPGKFIGANLRSADISIAQAFFLELVLTCLFVLVILMLAVEKKRDTYLAPIGIGLALFLVHIVAIPYTGCGVNPARSLAASVSQDAWTDQWIFWFGPLLGGALAGLLYTALKRIDYEVLNPGQDAKNEGEKEQKIKELQEADVERRQSQSGSPAQSHAEMIV